jgi:hypothetical protein
MYVIHNIYRRIKIIPDDDGKIDSNGSIFVYLRNDESCIVRILFHSLLNDAHPYSQGSPVQLPISVYQHPFQELSERDQAQLIWKGHYVANKYLIEKRLAASRDRKFPLSFIKEDSLGLVFGE